MEAFIISVNDGFYDQFIIAGKSEKAILSLNAYSNRSVKTGKRRFH
jgi:hypothetical protein